MSPFLINLYMDAIMRKVIKGRTGGVMLRQERVTDLDVADDVTLLTDSWLVMVALVKKMDEVSQRFGMNISAKKSVLLYIGRDEGNVILENIRLRDQTLKQAEEFTYVLNVAGSNGKTKQNVESRRAGATRGFGSLKATII